MITRLRNAVVTRVSPDARDVIVPFSRPGDSIPDEGERGRDKEERRQVCGTERNVRLPADAPRLFRNGGSRRRPMFT